MDKVIISSVYDFTSMPFGILRFCNLIVCFSGGILLIKCHKNVIFGKPNPECGLNLNSVLC